MRSKSSGHRKFAKNKDKAKTALTHSLSPTPYLPPRDACIGSSLSKHFRTYLCMSEAATYPLRARIILLRSLAPPCAAHMAAAIDPGRVERRSMYDSTSCGTSSWNESGYMME